MTDTDSQEADDANLLSWERRDEFGFLRALLLSAGEILFRPRKAFGSLRGRGGIAAPLLYALMVGMIRWMALPTSIVVNGFLFGPIQDFAAIDGQLFHVVMPILIMMISAPITIVIGVLIATGSCHLILMIFRGSGGGFMATYQVICYGSVTTSLFHWIPWIGVFIGGLWFLVIGTAGFSVMHKTSKWQALPAQLPMLLMLAHLLYLYWGWYSGSVVGTSIVRFPLTMWGVPPILIYIGGFS